MVRDRELLVVRHVLWEGPHRIVEAFPDLPVRIVEALLGDELPEPAELGGAVLMGGPMSVNDEVGYPELVREKAWIARALAAELPMLGVCLGAQLLADALGARVSAAPRPEIGWGPVSVSTPGDAVLGPLAPRTTVLHWHGEWFDTPPGATLLARSPRTPCQAFRRGTVWGLLFHLEADERLVDEWLAVEEMAGEARAALGMAYAEILRRGAREAASDLLPRSRAALESFAALVRARATGESVPGSRPLSRRGRPVSNALVDRPREDEPE